MTDEDELCPVCGKLINHKILNGYRNSWPEPSVPVCTTDDSETMYVHQPETFL